MESPTRIPFDDEVKGIQKSVRDVAQRTIFLKDAISNEPELKYEDREVVVDNIILSYRHIEEAMMRLDMVLQARGK